MRKFIFSALFFGFFASHSCFAESGGNSDEPEPLLSYDVQVDYNSRYIWRGIAYSNGSVVQPSFGVTFKDLYIWVWGNYDLSYGLEGEDFRRFNEIDANASYTFKCNSVTIEPSIFSYFYPRQDDSPQTAEFSVKISYDLDGFSIFTNQTVDMAEYAGAYFADMGLSYEKELGGPLSFEAETSLGFGSSKFNEAYLDISKDALNLYSLSLSFPYHLTESLSVCPHLELTVILDSDLRNQVDDETILNGGLYLTWEF